MLFYKLFSILLILSSSFPSLVHGKARSGGSDTGGGNVIYCDAPTTGERVVMGENGTRRLIRGNISLSLKHGRKYQFLDLFMAEHGLGPFEDRLILFAPPNQKISKAEYLIQALKRIRSVHPELAETIANYITANQRRMQPIPPSTYIPASSDARLIFLPIGCDPLGFGIFDDRKNILKFDPTIAEELPNMDLAAFEFHEAVYKYFRDTFKHTSSWDAQRIVGYAFSVTPFTLKELADDMDELLK